MNNPIQSTRRTSLAAAVAVALGSAGTPMVSSAATYIFDWTGWFTMLNSSGQYVSNTDFANDPPYYGDRTAVRGRMTYDTATGNGSMTIQAFSFFGSGAAVATTVTFQAIGDGNCTNDDPAQGCGTGNLLLVNMGFNWNTNSGIPVSLVWDATGFLSKVGSINVGDTIGLANTADSNGDPLTPDDSGGVYAESEDTVGGSARTGTWLNPMGLMPVVTTAWNTTPLCTTVNPGDGSCLGTNPSGDLPLIADTVTDATNGDIGIGGSPMIDGPFTGYNANFAIDTLTLLSDGSGPAFTEPSDITTAADPASTVVVNLGTVTDEGTGVTVEWSADGGTTWNTDDGTNAFTATISQTVNTYTISWKATDSFGNTSLATQTVTITINDTEAPSFVIPNGKTVPIDDISTEVTSIPATVSFGSPTATDSVEPNLTIEWSADGGTTWNTSDPNGNSYDNFSVGDNTILWRVTDVAGNSTTYSQTITVSLPGGVVGQPCTPDLDTVGQRLLEGNFTMRDPNGNVVGTPDDYVTGSIDTSKQCTDVACTESGATLESPTPFFGFLWTAKSVRLFGPGSYTFDTVQGPALSMTVGQGQIGAHMLFDWSVNTDIDVVVVWDVGCGAYELTTTDSDGDGIPGAKMVDGPFEGFSAAFNMNTKAGETKLASGGYETTAPVVKNSTDGDAPLPLDPGSIASSAGSSDAKISKEELMNVIGTEDSDVADSCVGGCFDFEVSGVTAGSSIQVVLPLDEPIPYYAVYRKYDTANNVWKNFVSDDNNSVETAALTENGRCPEPGSAAYSTFSTGVMDEMLRPGDQCVQLTIEDGGPNDADGQANGTVVDPSGVGVKTDPPAPTADLDESFLMEGGCTLGATPASSRQHAEWWLMGGLLALLGIRRRKA